MQSKATTVEEYLRSLPADRRTALEAVRRVILTNLDADYQEGMNYGMIGYFVPHSVYPAGYHCDPTKPLPMGGLASQKNHMSVYLMSVYGEGTAEESWFRKAWAKSGKKLDMGKCCIRFKRIEDLALDVIGEAIRRIPAKVYVAHYERAIKPAGQRTAKPTPKPKAKASKAPRGASVPAHSTPKPRASTKAKR